MRKLLLGVMVALLAGCAGGPEIGVEYAHDVYPVDLNVDVDDESMTLSWRRVGDGAIAGYQIYISEYPLVAKYPDETLPESVVAFNSTPFPGDTNPEDGIEIYEATGLENGKKYYVSVRVIFPDGELSRPTEEVVVVAGPRGEIELHVRYEGEPDGFSFARNEYVDADAVDNDLYYFYRDGQDLLGSPRRLSGFIRDTRFLVLPFEGSYEEVVAALMGSGLVATDDQVEVNAGDWVLLNCDDGTNALVNVLASRGEGSERVIRLWFAYSALAEELFF